MTAGWRVDCAWIVAALGPDESPCVDLTTRDHSVYVSSQDLELVEVHKSLEFAEVRRRVQDDEVARQASPECAKESPRTFRSQERREIWLRCYLRSICLPDLECQSSW